MAEPVAMESSHPGLGSLYLNLYLKDTMVLLVKCKKLLSQSVNLGSSGSKVAIV